jgi:hypothetical protein
MAGEMERIDGQVAALQVRRQQLVASHAALARVASLMALPGAPSAVPPVRAQSGLGRRGALRNFIRTKLREAAPRPVDTTTLTVAAMEHFELRFTTEAEYQLFRRRQIARTLGKLVDLGEVEGLHDRRHRGVNTVGFWRWNMGEPSTADLLAAPNHSEE